MSVERFHHDEVGYADWRAAHPDGFVFNNFGGHDRANNVLHRVTCRSLLREYDEGSRTNYEKICSDDIRSIREVVTCMRTGTKGWKECSICRPS